MKKIIILNGSPRKNFNTATLLKEAQKGAESIGAEVEYFNLGDINYKGCVSCFACKRKGSLDNPMCAYKDDLTPILEKILNSDGVIIGSPIYYSYPTGMTRNLLERMLFAAGTYLKDDNGVYTKRKLDRTIPIGLIYTMNCPEWLSKQFDYPTILAPDKNYLGHIFGHCEVLNSYDTYQFSDYSKYDMDLFDEAHKAEVREKQFPIDKQNAFNLGKNIAEFNK